MELLIDTTSNKNINLKINNIKITILTEHNQAEKLLPLINEFLRNNSIELTDITSIKVNNVGSSFTSLRIGVITANALGFALGIKVKSFEKSNNNNNKFNIISPIYDKEPNITVKN